MKKLAFTLAEVLLVIAIIGTVSVLTVNNAVKSTGTAEKITQLKKTYDILQAAVMAGMNDAGSPYKWGAYGSGTESDDYNKAIIEKVLVPHLKLQQNCGTGSGCWKSTVKANISNDPPTLNTSTEWYKFVLANGASVAIELVQLDGDTPIYDDSMLLLAGDYPTDQMVGVVYVDVDGPNKGAGKAGDDVFSFVLFNENGLYPYGNNVTLEKSNSDRDSSCPSMGEFCTAWALYKGNQDYFKCPDKLSWTDPEKSHCPMD